MIKIKLEPEDDGKFKSAKVVNDKVVQSSITGSELSLNISSAVENNEQLNTLRKITKLFKAKTILIKPKETK